MHQTQHCVTDFRRLGDRCDMHERLVGIELGHALPAELQYCVALPCGL